MFRANILIEDVFDILYLMGTDVIFKFFWSKKDIISASRKNLLDINFCFFKCLKTLKPFKPDWVSPSKLLSIVRDIRIFTNLLTRYLNI